MNTFTKEITYVRASMDMTQNPPVPIEEEVTKTATFKEVSRIDPLQKKLLWKITELLEGSIGEENGISTVKIPSDRLSDLTDKAIKVLLIPSEEFTDNDKRDFIQDTVACVNFGLWFLKEKCSPFFLKIKPG